MEIIKDLALNFCAGNYDHKVQDSYWPDVFEYLNKNAASLNFNASCIHTLWTVNGGHLRRKIANDALTLSVLLQYLPKYNGEAITLYRGECKFLYDDDKIGFCWTPKKDVARMFARGLNCAESGGVLLKAHAPSSAVISSPNDHSSNQMKEFEYTCNPNLLENIQTIEVFKR